MNLGLVLVIVIGAAVSMLVRRRLLAWREDDAWRRAFMEPSRKEELCDRWLSQHEAERMAAMAALEFQRMKGANR